MLSGHRPELDALVSLLLEVETVDGSDVYRLAAQPDRSETVPPVPPTTAVSAPQRAAASDTKPLTADAATGPMPADRPDAR